MKSENKNQGRRIEVIFADDAPIAEQERRLRLIDEISSRSPQNTNSSRQGIFSRTLIRIICLFRNIHCDEQ